MDPTLPLASLLRPLPHRATVQGTLSGGSGFPNAFDTVTFVVVAADDGGGSIVLPPGEGPAFGPIEVTWAGADATNATVHALQWRMDGARLPLEYAGHDSQPVALVDGDALDEALVLEPVETTFVTARPSWPADHRPTRATLHGRFGDHVAIPLAIDGAFEASVTYAVPRGAALGLQLSATAGEATSALYSLLSPGEVVSPALPPAPRLTGPANGTTGVDSETLFEWTAYDRSVHVMTASTPSGPSFAIYTVGARASLAATGVALASGAPYDWGVTAVGPYESLDELVDPDGGIPIFGQGRDARLGRTGIRSFTSAP